MAGRILTGLVLSFMFSFVSPTTTFGGQLEETTILNAVGQIGGPIQGVAVQDSIAYVTVGPRLMVMEVSESGSLTEMGGTPALPQFLRDVTVDGNHAYVAAGEAGIYVVDVSTQTNPTVVGSWDSPGFAEAVVVVGTTLYVADGPYGLRTVDVSDPAHPLEIGWAFPLHYAMDVAVSGNIAAIASVTAGLFIADVSNPANPVERGSLMTNGCAFGVDIDGQTAYLADGWGGLATVDISRPWMPEILVSYETPGWAMDVDVEDGFAFVGDGYRGLRVLDVSAPSAPVELSAFEFKGHAVKVVVSGSRALLVDRPSKLRTIDISETLNLTQTDVFASAGQVEDVAVSGDYAYLASGASGIHIIDISDASAPKRVAQSDTQGTAMNVAIDGGHAYVNTFHGPEGLEVFDVSDPTQPISVSFFSQLHGPYRDLEISGGIAFIPDETGFVAMDISDPAHPVEIDWLNLGGLETRDATAGVGVQGTLAAVAQAGDGTAFVDVSDPNAMTVLGRFESTFVWDVDLQGNWAYIADVGFRVLDISNPENPVEAGFASSSGVEGRGVVLDAVVAYVCYGKKGILAYDVSDPHHPIPVGGNDSLGFANKAVVQDGLIFVADREGGLLVLETLATKDRGFLRVRIPKRSEKHGDPQGIDNLGQTGYGRAQLENEWGLRRSSSRREQTQFSLVDEGLQSLRAREGRIRSPRTGNEQWSDRSGQMARAGMRGSQEMAVTCQVATTEDSGSGSLRWCLNQAESGDTIVFDPAVFPPDDPATILLSSELPQITQGGLTIDASDSGVILDGHNVPGFGFFVASDGNTIRGLQIYDFGAPAIGIGGSRNVIGGDRSIGAGPVGQGNVLSGNYSAIGVDEGASENIITGNLIGTDVTGRQARGNSGHGIHVTGHDNVIGGYEPGQRNIVSANGEAGIALHFPSCTGNQVIGNYLGTDIDGAAALGNAWYGVGAEQGPTGNLIEGNLCSGNEWAGILIVDEGSSYNTVVGNIVGLDAGGIRRLGNLGDGIYVGLTSAWLNRVGGALPEERNIVSGNQGAGIAITGADEFVLGNYVGTDVSGVSAIPNHEGVLLGYAEHSFVGGTRKQERNVISGNASWGVVAGESSHNMVMGNFVGVDAGGTTPLPNVEAGVLQGGSQYNFFLGNVVSGNQGGVVIQGEADYNVLRANRVGVAAEDPSAVPNQQEGVRIESASNQIGGPYPGDGNIVAHNVGGGVGVWTHPGNSILGNSIYGNNGWGIQLEDGGNNALAAPVITNALTTSVRGTSCAGCRVDVFSDEFDQGQVYEGSTVADGTGSFEFDSATRLRGPFVTCTTTDPEGNTSPFSEPVALEFVRRGGRRVSP